MQLQLQQLYSVWGWLATVLHHPTAIVPQFAIDNIGLKRNVVFGLFIMRTFQGSIELSSLILNVLVISSAFLFLLHKINLRQ